MGKAGIAALSFFKKNLEGVFLFVTSKCNSRCRTCFYHNELNSKQDMTFDEIKKISETSPKFRKLWLSGGEPTLREDLIDIVKMFYDNNDVRVLNFPTNGILTDRIDEMVGRLIRECPDMEVHLNFSLDGLGKTHDENRGVPGNFKMTVRSMQRIAEKYGHHKKLNRSVATVITPQNKDELSTLGSYLIKKGVTGAHVFEIPRGNPKDPTVQNVSYDELKKIRQNVAPLYAAQADFMFKDFGWFSKRFAKKYYIGFFRFMNDLQDANYDGPADWEMECTAGKTTFVIDHNGDFRSCEMRPPIGNLKDYEFNLSKALFSEAMKKEINEIGGGWKANCWCTHGCWVVSSLKFSPKAIFSRIPKAFKQYKKEGHLDYKLPDIDIEKIENYREDEKSGKMPEATA